MDVTTKVGRFDVRVRRASHPSLRFFASGAHGKKEAGVYAFWTVVIKTKDKKKRVWGRALTSLPPGDRFDRMKSEMRTARSMGARRVYRKMWFAIKGGAAIKYIRPSTESEIARWMDGHKRDAKHAKRMKVCQ